MKIALILKGSSINKYKHWQYGDEIYVDYKESIDNIKENIISQYDCDVFFHTWENIKYKEEYKSLISDYNPIKYKIEKDIPGSHGPELGKKVVITTKSAIDCFLLYSKEKNAKYDLIIISRFDLSFPEKLNLSEIIDNYNLEEKIVFVHETKEYIWGSELELSKDLTKDQGLDDNFVILTNKALNDYYNCLSMKTETIAVDRNPKWFNPKQHPSLHHIYYLMEDDTKIINLYKLLNKKYKHMHSIVKLYGKERKVRIVPYV